MGVSELQRLQQGVMVASVKTSDDGQGEETKVEFGDGQQ